MCNDLTWGARFRSVYLLTCAACLYSSLAFAQIGSGPTLPAGDCNTGGGSLFYLTAGNVGLYVCESNAWTKKVSPGGAGPTFVVTTQDTTNATTSYANITGLAWNVAASTRYRISCVLPYDANATTTGIGIGWTGPASPVLTRGFSNSGLTAATIGGTTINGNDTGGATTASVATTGNVAHFEGIWSNGANAGTLQMRVKSEVAVTNAIIVRTGAVCSYLVY